MSGFSFVSLNQKLYIVAVLLTSKYHSIMAMYNNIFKITHNDVLPAQGSILISEPFLQDAYFQRSVVLLVEHTQEGSMGFVLNKKTELSVNTFFADLQEFPEMPIYLGGPVSANRLFLSLIHISEPTRP